jgi:16S rRNA (cytidine1402-2'-O)-methyltransferase
LYVEERELKAALYVVPTPIGNIGDMTVRSVEVLQSVDVIAAEDTRHSRALLNHYEVKTPLVSFHEYSGETATMALAGRIAQGERVALISDAGTPLVSDPGYQLVRAVQSLGMPVVPLPGPCAAITALSAAGLPTHSFQFVGFLPSKQSSRRRRLEALKSSQSTIILYEAPHRILDLLEDIESVLGAAREVCIARELTKAFETIHRDGVAAILNWVRADANQQRGEFVVMIAADVEKEEGLSDDALQLLRALSNELPPRKSAQIVAEHYDLKSRDLYQTLINRE